MCLARHHYGHASGCSAMLPGEKYQRKAAGIQAGFVKSDLGLHFLPNDKLNEIFSYPTIKSVIKTIDCDKDELLNLPKTIQDGGKRVLAMLIWQGRPGLIVEFRNHGLLDSRLPFEEADMKRLAGEFDGIELATRTQWAFCPYVFPEDMWEHHRQIDRRIILPFTETERIGDGAFGEIDKISISPSQQHLIDRGLIKYFSDKHSLAGLASALAKTHNLNLNDIEHNIDLKAIGYHHDIRPPNILVAADTFVLADFGLGKVKPEDAPSYTPYKPISGDYVAPECTDMDENSNIVNRAIDVWAFGCLMFEVATYMLRGVDGIKEFRTKRTTPGRLPQWDDSGFYKPQGDAKEEVRRWKDTLIRSHPDSGMTEQLLEVAMKALHREPGKRPKMDFISQRLLTLSMRKYFIVIQEMFGETYELLEKQLDHNARQLEKLRYARARFRVWGDTLSLSDNFVSDHSAELSGRSVEIMKELLRQLNVTGRQNREHETSNSLLLQGIESLWQLMPSPRRQSADARWSRSTASIESTQYPQDPHPMIGGNQSVSERPAVVHRIESEFEKAAQIFKRGLPKSVSWNEILEVASSDEFYIIAAKLQEQQSQTGRLRNLAKIKLFLDRLEGFTRIITDTVSEHRDILAAIWGPIALLLQWAKDLDHAYDSLLSAFAGIGPKLPDFEIPHQNSEIGEIMLLFFKDLLNIYHDMLELLSHRGKAAIHAPSDSNMLRPSVLMLITDWMHIFEHLWPKHDANIREIGSHIERLTRLLRTEIRLEHIQQEYDFRNTALRDFKKREMAANQEDFNRIMTSFGPKRYDQTLDYLRARHSGGTSNWLFSNAMFRNWLDGSTQESRILWMKGIPGAGKTFLSGAVVHLLRSEKSVAAFVFLTYKEAETSALSTFQSLVFQLAEMHADLKAIVCQSMDEHLRSDLDATSRLLSKLIIHAGPVYFVVDGVDEISRFERHRLVMELLQLSKSCSQLRIILSSRPEADLVQKLADAVESIQVDDHNEASIRSYVHQQSQQIFDGLKMRPGSPNKIRGLLSPLASKAKGMFLYARLVMNMLSSMHEYSDIEKSLEVLPENLDEAYRRIMDRLWQIQDNEMAKRARRLLGWIASSPQPMSIEEAQQALVVNPQERNQVFNIIAKLNVVAMLGPIVETVDSYIHFVHFTAKEYIASDHLGLQLINPTQATLDLAICCISYLCQSHHDPDITDGEVTLKASSGQYSFHAFSSKMWFQLICQYLRLVEATGQWNELVQAIQKLRETRGSEVTETTEDEELSDVELSEDGFGILKEEHPALHELLLRVCLFRQNSYLFTGTKDRDPKKDQRDPLSISATSQRIRQVINGVVCNSPTGECSVSSNSKVHQHCQEILFFYGPRPFRCKFPLCRYWQDGFPTRNKRDQHERLHDVLLQCDVSGCEFGEIGFLSRKMRQLHLKTAHQSSVAPVAQRRVDCRTMKAEEIEAVLTELVQKDQVDKVNELLNTSTNLLEEPNLRKKLQLLAASQASGDMLNLLDGRRKLETLELHDCTEESIKYFPSADEQVLYLWKKFGVIAKLKGKDSRSACRILKAVAKHSLSIMLAAYLLDLGADINHRKHAGERTALHLAARHASAKGDEMMEFLLLRGANPTTDQVFKGRLLRRGRRRGRSDAKTTRIRDEKGPQTIHQRRQKTWDELVEETMQARIDKEAGKLLMS
ncbi:hypothetical protein G7054_g10484 [Neopestalotiopsis clavispora]|nr:hypothetical protein G7054_g10484 [Neopestalotiopsis clavispora]